MCPAVTYTPYATSSKEQTGDVITFTQFEEGNLISETCKDTEIDDESGSESIMMSKREARLAIRARIKQKKLQWKGALRATHKMGKGLHRVFSTIVSEILQEMTNFGHYL